MTAEVRKLQHLGLKKVPRCSTLSDANARRSDRFFEEVYLDFYSRNKDKLSSDSRGNGGEEWIRRLRIIDSTTLSLFSNAIFKGVRRHPKTGSKVHSVIHANEGVPCDVQFTSAATNDSFMLAPNYYQHEEIIALDRVYINYRKFEELTDKGVVYVTKMKNNLTYETLVDCMEMNTDRKMEYREQVVVFRRNDISHIARIITYVDIKKNRQSKLISLLTNDFDMSPEDYSEYISSQMADRIAFQADKTELPVTLLLRGERKCHQNPNTGHTDSKPAVILASKLIGTQLELLRPGHHGQNGPHVLSQHL